MDNRKNHSNPPGKGGSGLLGYLLAGAVGVVAGLVVKKIVDNKDEEKKLNEQKIANSVPINQPQPQPQQIRRIDSYSTDADQTDPYGETDTKRFDLENCEDIVCPITYEIMEKPMISKACGHSFEEKAIVDWLAKRDKCPKCNAPITRYDLVENYSLKNTIAYMKAQSLYVKSATEGQR